MRTRALVVIVALLVAPALFSQCMGKFRNGIIHAFAETAGGGGSQWTTDVIITDVGAPKGRAFNDVEIWVWINTAGGLRSIGKHYSIPAGGTLRIPNVLSDIGAPTTGVLIGHISATYDVVANARIYNTQASRGDLKPGFGQGLPAIDENKGLATGEWTQFPVPTNPNEARVNVGVANISWSSATVLIELFDHAGNKYYSNTLMLQMHEVKQVQVNGSVPSGSSPGNVKVTVQYASGNAIYPYVSVADNVPTGSGLPTSDPSFFFITR
jgi:hypothetical protein